MPLRVRQLISFGPPQPSLTWHAWPASLPSSATRSVLLLVLLVRLQQLTFPVPTIAPPVTSSSYVKQRHVTRQKILNWKQSLRFPSRPRVSHEAVNLMEQLLCEPEDRLGSQASSSVSRPNSMIVQARRSGFITPQGTLGSVDGAHLIKVCTRRCRTRFIADVRTGPSVVPRHRLGEYPQIPRPVSTRPEPPGGHQALRRRHSRRGESPMCCTSAP